MAGGVRARRQPNEPWARSPFRQLNFGIEQYELTALGSEQRELGALHKAPDLTVSNNPRALLELKGRPRSQDILDELGT